jgi:hypothetical protein
MPERQRLERTWYKTDIDPSDADYVGTFSAQFPAEDATRRIVRVDWSPRGEVEVTWLVGVGVGDRGFVPRAVEEVDPL